MNLNLVEVGDFVKYRTSSVQPRRVKVIHTTPTRITTPEGTFRRVDGELVGKNWYFSSISPWTPEDVEAYKNLCYMNVRVMIPNFPEINPEHPF